MKKLFFVDGENYEEAKKLLQSGGIMHVPTDVGVARECIENTLFDIGVPKHTLGFSLLITAIEIELVEKGAITKITYPEIARRMSTNVINVERNIRFALDRTWINGLNKNYYKYFQHPYDRAPNSVFISTVTEIVRKRLENESFGD